MERKNLIVNLAEVDFVASSGVGSLLALTEEFEEEGLRICFVHLSDVVESVIKLLNLDSFLTILEDEAAASEHLEAA